MIGYEGKIWVAYFWFVGWDCWSLGAHICVGAPNIEIHVPFGFFRIGRRSSWRWNRKAQGWACETNGNSWSGR